MAITGIHTLLYSPEAEALRDTLRDVFGWHHVDTGGGWLIFALPPAEMGVHPAEEPAHQISIMCDDLATTMDELSAEGIEFNGEPWQETWGHVVIMTLPGGVDVMLYEPRHPVVINP